ncbi:MAG: PepSY protein [Sphingomonas bacterium]|nr:PepSY protein [Sphingomonas bacterium]
MTRGQVRNLWFQVHKWIGLILCLVLIPLSITGSLLVWHEGLDRLLHGHRFPASGAATMPVSRYIEAATPLLPRGGRITTIVMPAEEAGAVIVRMAPPAPAGTRPAPGRPRSLSVWIDPRSAAVLDSEWSDQGVMRFLHVFHGSLLIPGVGRAIVGWLGVLMLISSISGIWIWWPTIGRWARGLRWRRGNKFDYNMHHSVGFWVALPLALLSLTGAWISFPAFFGAIVGESAPRRPPGLGGAGAAPAGPVRLTPDGAAALAMRQGKLAQLALPVGDPPAWNATVLADDGTQKRIEIDDDSGAISDARQPPRGAVARLMRTLHDGNGTGIVYQTIIFLGGIAPAALGITGVTMWLRSRRWRGKAEAKGRAKANDGAIQTA